MLAHFLAKYYHSNNFKWVKNDLALKMIKPNLEENLNENFL